MLGTSYHRLNNRGTPEQEKRWLSWTIFVNSGLKASYVKPSDEEIAKRRARGKRQRAARKLNR